MVLYVIFKLNKNNNNNIRVSVSDFLGVGPPMPPLRPPLHNLLVGGPGGARNVGRGGAWGALHQKIWGGLGGPQ